LPRELGLAYNTVLTTLRILEDKGFLRHTKAKEGRAFVYRAVVDREQTSRTALRHLVSRFFRNSPELLVLNLLEDEDLSAKELSRIRELIGRGRMNSVISAILNSVWQAAGVAAVAWAILRFSPKMNAATRHAVWWAVLAAVIALPAAQPLMRPRQQAPAASIEQPPMKARPF